MTEKTERHPEAETAVSLVCDGREVPLNPFVRRFIAATIRGLVRALDGVPENPVTVEIRVGKM